MDDSLFGSPSVQAKHFISEHIISSHLTASHRNAVQSSNDSLFVLLSVAKHFILGQVISTHLKAAQGITRQG